MSNHNQQIFVALGQSKAGTSTKLASFLVFFALLLFSASAFAQAEPCTVAGLVNTFGLSCAFYAGNFDPNNVNANALANETDAIVGGSPYGAATFQNFNWSGGNVGGFFTNNLSQLNPASGYWEVRSGVSEGNPGVLIASGTGSGGNFSHMPTGNTAFGLQEYTDAVATPGLYLPAGNFHFSVVPTDPNNPARSYNTNTFVSGGQIGSDVDNNQYFDSAFFGANFDNANNWGVFQDFSSGVLAGSVPEPSTLVMLGSGVLSIGGLLRRSLMK